MVSLADPVGSHDAAPATSDPTGSTQQSAPRTRLVVVSTGALATVTVVLGVLAAAESSSTIGRVAAVVTAVWGVAAVAVAVARPKDLLGPLMAVVSTVAAIGVGASVSPASTSTVERVELWSSAITAAALLHLAVALPDGAVRDPRRRGLVAVGYGAAVLLAGISGGAIRWDAAPTVGVVAVAAITAITAYADRCRRAGPVDRARLQWAGWGVVVTGLVALLSFTLRQLLDWPHEAGAVALVATTLVPLSLALGSFDRVAVRIDRLLTHTIIVAGLLSLVAAVYLVIVLGLGDVPDEPSQRLLALSMVAALLAAVLALPARRRLDEIAHRRVYGDRRSPDEALETFGSRMSRAVPMDELLLQLAETLKASMRLSSAEVWTGSEGVLERAVSVPDRGARRISISGEELSVVSRARVSGNAWMAVWIPALLEGRSDRMVRVAPVAHSGSLLGLLVVERPGDAIPFVEEEERVLTELARQVGLALHNVRLDSALQASLEELEVRNEQLQASRLRIVTAADESRRSIERNLHDGAQQHLVALAVKVGLIRQLLDADPTTATALLDELRSDVQATLTELRDLAHGIYPPLLRERGLAEALQTAANRAVLPTTVTADDIGRYSSEVEAAVYFCCLEALQNAGKHAGDGASVRVEVSATPDELTVGITDDGVGFDPAAMVHSHGFVNMADRIGAVGGRFSIDSTPGAGTAITCRIPTKELTADA